MDKDSLVPFVPIVLRFFMNKVANRTSHDDLVSETFHACAASLGKFKGDSSFRTYLYAIAKNILRGHIRQATRAREDPDLTVTSLRDLGATPSSIVARKKGGFDVGLLDRVLRVK